MQLNTAIAISEWQKGQAWSVTAKQSMLQVIKSLVNFLNNYQFLLATYLAGSKQEDQPFKDSHSMKIILQ